GILHPLRHVGTDTKQPYCTDTSHPFPPSIPWLLQWPSSAYLEVTIPVTTAHNTLSTYLSRARASTTTCGARIRHCPSTDGGACHGPNSQPPYPEVCHGRIPVLGRGRCLRQVYRGRLQRRGKGQVCQGVHETQGLLS
ncbi:hypothetical protein TPAR_04782, partial [Tolypocladium paradoxum]